MRVFKNTSGEVEENLPSGFDSEEELHRLIVDNIGKWFEGIEIIRNEFIIGEFRSDTLAFDNDKRCFVLIEYKNTKNKSVLDQIFAYYAILKKDPSKFILEYIKQHKDIEIDELNPEESYSIIISTEFTQFQKTAAEGIKSMRDISKRIRLYEILKYGDVIILKQIVEPSKKNQKAKANTESKYKQIDHSEISFSSLNEHHYLDGEYRGNPSNSTRDLYNNMKERMGEIFKDLEITVRNTYIGFSIPEINSYLCTFDIKREKIIICFDSNYIKNEDSEFINTEDSKFIEDMQNKGKWGIGRYMLEIKDAEGIDRAIRYISTAFKEYRME